MQCAYCLEKKKLTGEHLFPTSLIDLFPECDINVVEEKVFKSEKIVINDVCENCNNNLLSKLDSYGAELVKENFVTEYKPTSVLPFSYSYSHISRWLIKILFNNARSLKLNTEWYESNLDYILGHESTSNYSFSIFAGLWVNTSPMPDFYFDNMKLNIIFNPDLMSKSIIGMDIENNEIKVNRDIEKMNFKNLMQSSLLRFGSGMFLVFLWDKDTQKEIIEEFEEIMASRYPYTLLEKNVEKIPLRRVTHAFNCHHNHLIDDVPGIFFADQANGFLPPDRDPIEIQREQSVVWNQHVGGIRENRASKRRREREKRQKRKEKRNR